MLHQLLAEQIVAELGYSPTGMQQKAIEAISQFLFSRHPREAFILRGYAGTGKTTLVGALVRVLRKLQREVVLLAPTGRAAKVFSRHAGEAAYTIHKVIYRQETFRGEDTHFSLGYNKLRHALFIVDEASMIALSGGGNNLFGTGSLLNDLVNYVEEGEGCRLLFVGDSAQLPPVTEEESPALNSRTLRHLGLQAQEIELTEVVRQATKSGVLHNATHLRKMLASEDYQQPIIYGSRQGEVRFLPADELIEALVTAYTDHGPDETIVVTRSNKRANVYNRGIRARIFDREEQLTRGDRIMAVKNNYYWTEKLLKTLSKDERLPFDFIANGDTAEVIRIRNVHQQHGFNFADATLQFPDYEDFEMEVRVLLDTLDSESPSLSNEESQRLFESVLEDYADIPTKAERMKRLRQDPYYNALQIKYAYAVTCHKAQGGQWSRVFVDQGYLADGTTDTSYLRWLYTAFTRTTQLLYLVNWPKQQTCYLEDEMQ